MKLQSTIKPTNVKHEEKCNLQLGKVSSHEKLPLSTKSRSKLENPPLHFLKQEFNRLNLEHLRDSKKLEILKSIRDKKLFLFTLCNLVKGNTMNDSIYFLIRNLERATTDRSELGLQRYLVETIASNGDYTTAIKISQALNIRDTRKILSLALVNSSGRGLQEIVENITFNGDQLSCKELTFTLSNLDTCSDKYRQLFMEAISRFPNNGNVAMIVAKAFRNINGTGNDFTGKIIKMMGKTVLNSESLQVYILKYIHCRSSGEYLDPMDRINLLSFWTRMGINVAPQALICAAEGNWKTAALGLEFIRRNINLESGLNTNRKNHSLITQRLINLLLLSSHSKCTLSDYDTLLNLQQRKSPVINLSNLKNFARIAIERNSTARIENLITITNSREYDSLRDKFVHFVFREMTRVNTLPACVIDVYKACNESIKSNPGIIFFMLLSLRSRSDLQYLQEIMMLLRGKVDDDLVEKVFSPWLEGFGADEEFKTLVKEILIEDL